MLVLNTEIYILEQKKMSENELLKSELLILCYPFPSEETENSENETDL